MRLIVLLTVLVGLLIVAVWGSLTMWQSMGEVDLPAAGLASLLGGVLATFVVGVGLMALLFYSSRRGHDQAASDSAGEIGRAGGPGSPESRRRRG